MINGLLRLGLVRQTGWSGLAYLLPQGTNLLLIPVLATSLGIDRYGVWVLITTLVTILASLDGGLGASLLRFFSLHRGMQDAAATSRYLAAGIASAGICALVTVAALLVLGPRIVQLTTIPGVLQNEVLSIRHLVGFVAGLAIVANVLASLLRAYDYYNVVALAVGTGQIAYVGAVFGSLAFGANFTTSLLIRLFSLQHVVAIILLGIGALLRIHPSWAGWPRRVEWRQLWAYAWRTQVATASAIVNLQVDALIIGLLFPIRYVAFYSFGSAVAVAARSIPLFALPPICSRLTAFFGQSGLSRAVTEYNRIQQWWVNGIIAYSLMTACTLPLAISAWLVTDYRVASMVAVILFTGYAVNLIIGAMGCLSRAAGRPELESRVGIIAMSVNLILTYPLARLVGLYGVVAATAIGHLVATAYFPLAIRRSFGRIVSLLPKPRRIKILIVLLPMILSTQYLVESVLGAGLLSTIAISLLAAGGMVVWTIVALGVPSNPDLIASTRS